MAQPAAPPRRRRLAQKPAAVALGIGLLAVPLLPLAANAVLPERDWAAEAGDETSLELETDGGQRVVIDALDGWQVTDEGTSLSMTGDGTVVLVEVYDRMDRDPAAVAQRLMRVNRLHGINAALDGGVVGAQDGAALSGDTCVAVTTATTGTCAFLYDDEVVVSVIALGEPDRPAPHVRTIIDRISREDQS
ncbi:hypothetical protein [Mycobacterium sp. C31M]